MLKRIIALALALLLAAAPALAEVFTGSTVARSSLNIAADAGGILDELYVRPGSAVQKGDVIARLRTTRVFASQNGTVARIHAEVGEETQGAVLEIAPVSLYTIHCTAEDAYDSIETQLLRCGESLFMKCTVNGSHRGEGRIYAIDGETYMVEATAGEFYVGETVYLYRDADYSYKQRVGVGTVVSAATETYESEGRITAIHVSEGEYVEKGELLYELIDGESAEITAPVDGIITSCEAENGAAIENGQCIAVMAALEEICVAVQLEDSQIALVSVGDSAALRASCDGEERLVPGIVAEISNDKQDESYTAYILPEEAYPRLGMTAEVRIG